MGYKKSLKTLRSKLVCASLKVEICMPIITKDGQLSCVFHEMRGKALNKARKR